MLGGNIYINGTGIISPQFTLNNEVFLEEIAASDKNSLLCKEPSYKEFIEPIQIRRMSRILKMGVAAAKMCIKDANAGSLDGIIVGTGLGCIEDTEKFLTNIFEKDADGLLSPTSFIQSTHNSISSYIALLEKCNAYNNTFVHRGFSFESSLIDAMMLLKESENENILVGGVDEITPNSYAILGRIGYWKKTKISSLDLLKYSTKGTIAGEGASFAMLGNQKSSHYYGRLAALRILYQPADKNEIVNQLQAMIGEADLTIEDVDLVILGLNGNVQGDEIYYDLGHDLFKNKNKAYFKHLCGEYHTASAFAFWLAAKMLKMQHVPEICKLEYIEDKPIHNILVYNHYFGLNHSMYIISK